MKLGALTKLKYIDLGTNQLTGKLSEEAWIRFV